MDLHRVTATFTLKQEVADLYARAEKVCLEASDRGKDNYTCPDQMFDECLTFTGFDNADQGTGDIKFDLNRRYAEFVLQSAEEIQKVQTNFLCALTNYQALIEVMEADYFAEDAALLDGADW